MSEGILYIFVIHMAASDKKSFWDRFGPIMAGIMVVMVFALGMMWGKLSYFEKYGTASPNTQGTTEGTTNPNAAAPQAPKVEINTIKNLFAVDGLVKFGDENKKVLFVDVSDPSCPYCHAASGMNNALNKQMGPQFLLTADGGTYVAPVPEMKKLVNEGKAGYIFLYQNGHGSGEMGTKAMYCANEKGKYWEVHDLLMSEAGYEKLNTTVKNDVAKSADLAKFLQGAYPNTTEMQACLESGKYNDQLAKDSQLAKSLGVSGTPGFYINTTNFAGAYSWKDMESVVNEALN